MTKPKLYLLNGPLGAGKTTFLRFLLSQPEFKQARVIENEFASVSVDTESLHDHTAKIATIAGLCICCSDGNELIEALERLAVDSSQPVIIEATGVANSLQLIEKLVVGDVLDKYHLAQGVFVLDASELVNNLNHDLEQYRQELSVADLVLVSKIDIVTDNQASDIFQALNSLGVSKAYPLDHGRIDIGLIKNNSSMLEKFAETDEDLVAHDNEVNYTVLDIDDPLDPYVLKQSWPQLQAAYSLRRLKGDVIDNDGVYWHIEATPAQLLVTDSSADQSKLVAIGGKARELTQAKLLKELS